MVCGRDAGEILAEEAHVGAIMFDTWHAEWSSAMKLACLRALAANGMRAWL